ncbi:hypothetical protein D9753_33880 [Streptomyces dangxiongensis]|uniref:SRPBCC family protein n=1 Tax=Streptomyces dangxiongensis TaxID=1442032 RepID=A0A3G2JNB3_9ACTN|nr:hypothetical protein [Streptomyces dangxiongensis]AYN43051.1 hypothetical protein D9753_33880 [Streptomyces dangxiongensis]
MAEYERSRTMPALPEHVFDRAADITQLDAWLPDRLHVDVENPPAVTVHEDSTGQVDEGHDPGEQAVYEALDGSLGRLEEQVRIRVDNPAG